MPRCAIHMHPQYQKFITIVINTTDTGQHHTFMCILLHGYITEKEVKLSSLPGQYVLMLSLSISHMQSNEMVCRMLCLHICYNRTWCYMHTRIGRRSHHILHLMANMNMWKHTGPHDVHIHILLEKIKMTHGKSASPKTFM